MPLFISDEELWLLGGDTAAVAERADAAIRDLGRQVDTVRAEADAAAMAAEHTCALLEQRYASLSAEFDRYQAEAAAAERRAAELASSHAEIHQLLIQADTEVERLKIEISELHKSKCQLIEQRDEDALIIKEKDGIIYDKILEREISESSSSLRRSKERISELEQRVSYMEKSDWAELKKELQEQRDHVRDLALDMKNVFGSCMKQVEDMRKELNNSWKAASDAESRAAIAEAKCSDLEAKCSDLEAKLKSRKVISRDGGHEISAASEENDELFQLKEELKKYKEEAQANNNYMEQLPDDIVEEILLRFPPADPASLVRAALVCKLWCRIVCGRSFRRRLMAFHRVAPPLGILYNLDNAQFVPTSSFLPLHTDGLLALHDCEGVEEEELWDWQCIALDARDGLVLLYFEVGEDLEDLHDFLVVWDPTTDERWKISFPDILYCEPFDWYATVLCVSTTANGHLDCHDMPFVVVRVVTEWQRQRWCLRVYSSEDASWSEETLLPKCRVDNVPTALVGNTLYFMINFGKGVLSFDLATRKTSVIRLPSEASGCVVVLMAMEDGGLGFARVDMAGRLSLWSMETNPNGDMGWTQTRVIELEKLLSVSISFGELRELGLAYAVGVFFVLTSDGELFSFELKSGRVRKIHEEDEDCVVLGRVPYLVPYTGFCTPGHLRYEHKET